MLLAGLYLFITVARSVPTLLSQCPPKDAHPLSYVDLDRFVSSPWFFQQQMPVLYQKANDFYCVRDELTLSTDRSIVYFRTTYRRDGVDGKPIETFLSGLIDTPSSWQVGPRHFPRFMRSSYWIIAIDPGYQWAIISGGPPTISTQNGHCRNSYGLINAGLWLMTRESQPDPSMVQKMLTLLEEKGYDTSVLLNVQQKGCTYPPLQKQLTVRSYADFAQRPFYYNVA